MEENPYGLDLWLPRVYESDFEPKDSLEDFKSNIPIAVKVARDLFPRSVGGRRCDLETF